MRASTHSFCVDVILCCSVRFARLPVAGTILLAILLAGCGDNHSIIDPSSSEIQNKILSAGDPPRVIVQSDSVLSFSLVRLFYEARSYRPAWSSPNGMLPDADSLLEAIKMAERDGLHREDYHLRALDSALVGLQSPRHQSEQFDPSQRAALDLLMTDAFLLYASHLSDGCVDRDSLRMRWRINPKDTRLDTLLERSLASHSVGDNLRLQPPQHQYYADLKDLLATYSVAAKRGGWGVVPAGPVLKGGDAGSRVFALKNRLRASGDLVSRSGARSDEYDSTLVDAVRVFQKRHGIEPGGIADSVTIAAMNVPLGKRIDQIRITMERWRWMPHDLGRKHIRINIPDFRLCAVEDGKELESMKVVLGLASWQTPVFSAELTQVLFNSHWMAPEDIVEKELINYMKADSNYLRSNNMTLWRELNDSLVQVDPKTIDWPSMNEKTVDFRLRQDPGPQNIMGQVKFLIPNRFNIYLHDTPYRDDFAKNVRMFSHGCIRLERPFDLAEYVLRSFSQWTREKIDTVIVRSTESTIFLKKPIPVHVLYYTVWKEKDGSTQIREDFYGLDRRLASILAARPMTPTRSEIALKTAIAETR